MSLFIHILFRNVITHSWCVVVFGLNVILFQVSQPMMMIMLEMEGLSPSQGNALIDVTLGHRTFNSHVMIS